MLTGKNMCNELTGGWQTARTTYSCDGGNSYGWYLGWMYTNNKIDLTGYSKMYISSNMIGNSNENFESYIYIDNEKQTAENGLIITQNTNYREQMEFVYHNVGKTSEIINVPNNLNGYIGLMSAHSMDTTYYFDYKESYIRNYTYPERYIDVYSIIALKEDDWKNWAKLAEIDTEKEESNTLEKILNNTTMLEKAFKNSEANKYLLNCTGTLMVEILKNDTSYNTIPSNLLSEMKNNESWNHFLKVCERN